MLNPDFSDMLSALSAENAEFLVVGGKLIGLVLNIGGEFNAR